MSLNGLLLLLLLAVLLSLPGLTMADIISPFMASMISLGSTYLVLIFWQS